MVRIVALLLLLGTACGQIWRPVPPGLQIVLADSRRVFLADWRGGDLDPRLLTDFTGVARLSPGSMSAAADVIGVAGASAEGGRVTSYFLIDALTGAYRKVFEEANLDVIANEASPQTDEPCTTSARN